MTISKAQHAALMIVAGCPDGVTTYALDRLNGVSVADMKALIDAKLVWAQHQRISWLPGVPVIRLRITDKGRQQLKPGRIR